MNVVNRTPFLRTSREFPEELHQLTVEVNKTYVDIANAVNNRTISLFPTNIPAVTGESWFLSGIRRQYTFRRVYTFVAPNPYPPVGGVLRIPHDINVADIQNFTRIYGTFVDTTGVSPIYYSLPYVDVISATNQITLTVDNTNINIYFGAGAIPTTSQGIIVLEWLSFGDSGPT